MSDTGQSRRLACLHRTLALACTTTAVCVSVTESVRAQTVDISGYYENTLQIDYTSLTKDQLLNTSKLRLDLSSSLAGGFEFVGNVNFLVNVGALERDLRAYLPDSAAQELTDLAAPTIFSIDPTRIFLDNAYLSWVTGPMRLRLGLQQLSWGPGYSYNPTDLFHRKTLLDPTYEKEGVAALRFDYRWGVGGQASLITAPSEDFESSGYALRLGTHLSSVGYDVALTGHYVRDSTAIDMATSTTLKQRRYAAGLEVSGTLIGLGAWLEGNYNWMEAESNFARFVLGADYTTDGGTYLMLEWLYNGRSEAAPPYPVEDWLANLYYGEPVGPGWIMAGTRKDLSDLTLGSLYLFAALDGSFMINPRVDVSVAQNADLVAFGGLTVGREDGVFAAGIYSLLARLTIYF